MLPYEFGILQSIVDNGLWVEDCSFGREESGGEFEGKQTVETTGFGSLKQARTIVPISIGQARAGIVGHGAVLQMDMAYGGRERGEEGQGRFGVLVCVGLEAETEVADIGEFGEHVVDACFGVAEGIAVGFEREFHVVVGQSGGQVAQAL